MQAEAFLIETLPRRVDGDPLAMGSPDAPVVLTEWADYRCPFCSVWAEETLPQLQHYIDDGTDAPECLPNYCPNCGAKMDGGYDDATS